MIYNNGYPYAISCSPTTVTLKVQTDATDVEWFNGTEDNQSYSTGVGKEITINPDGDTWYSCKCDGEQAKAIKISHLNEYPVLNSNLPGYWYITNEVMAYTVNVSDGKYCSIDILGSYKKDETTYWMSTTYKWEGGWELFSSGEQFPSPQGYTRGTAGAEVEDICLSFAEGKQHTIYFEVYPGEAKSFSIGADVMLGSAEVTPWADKASLKAIFDGESFQQVQMVGAKNIQSAELTDPALVFKLDTVPSTYWLGAYDARRHYAFNMLKGDGFIYEDPSNKAIVSECQGLDSGMTVSWLDLSPDKPIKFSFGVGSVKEAGAVISNVAAIWTNLNPEDHTGGEINTSDDLLTLTAVPALYCTFSEWRTKDGEIIVPRMYASMNIASIEGPILNVVPESEGVDVVAHFIKNFTVTYLKEPKLPQVEVFDVNGTKGVDDNIDHTAYPQKTSYTLLEPVKTFNEFYFKEWELQTPLEGEELIYGPGATYIITQNTEFKPIWLPFPKVIFSLGDIVLDPPVQGELPETLSLAPGTIFVLPAAEKFKRFGHSLKGWTTLEFKACYPVGDAMQVHEEDIILIPVWKKDPFVDMTPEDRRAFMDGLRALYINMIKYYTFQDNQTNFIVQNIWGIVHRLQVYKEKYGTWNLLRRDDVTLCYNKAKKHVSIKERFPENKIRLTWMPDWGLENILDCDWMKMFLRRYAKTVEAQLFARIFHDMEECGCCWN